MIPKYVPYNLNERPVLGLAKAALDAICASVVAIRQDLNEQQLSGVSLPWSKDRY